MRNKIILTIIIPAHFEEKNITRTLDAIESKVRTPHEIIVVYDLDEDPTVKAVSAYKNKKNNIFAVKNTVGSKRGVINALKTGIKIAKAEIIGVIMADLSDDVAKIDQAIKLINDGYDIVCFSRYMKGGRQMGGPFLKGLISKLAGLTLYYFFKLPTHDPTNSFKIYRKSIFDKIRIESDGGFEYNLEIIVKAFKQGYRITEIPSTWKDRTHGRSKFKLLKWLPKYLRWYYYLISN